LYLRFRFIGKEGIDDSVLRLEGFDQSFAFIRDFCPKFRLLRGGTLFREEVSNGLLRLLT
jgi:hypothetical protein